MYNKLEILKNLRLLFMEDEHELFELYKEILGEFFLEVVAATDGEKGLNLYKEYINDGKHIDLVLSDINMPVMNGLDAAKEIIKINNEIPIIFLTGHNDSNYILESIKIGAAEYILKPVDTADLINKLFKAYLPIYQSKIINDNSIKVEKNNNSINKLICDYKDTLNITEIIENFKK